MEVGDRSSGRNLGFLTLPNGSQGWGVEEKNILQDYMRRHKLLFRIKGDLSTHAPTHALKSKVEKQIPTMSSTKHTVVSVSITNTAPTVKLSISTQATSIAPVIMVVRKF